MSGSVSMIDGHIDEVLEPCPFCGGHIVLSERSETIDEIYTEVVCTSCCMHFSYTEYFSYLSIARVRQNSSFVDRWNGRTGT